jgi:hypothetical protein
MSTRANVLVIDREWAEYQQEGFACNPEEVKNKSYVNMYLHHDGYPSWRGVELANWIEHKKGEGWKLSDPSRVSAQLVHDFHYDSQYLYPSNIEIDVNYTYIIWTKSMHEPWVSIYNNYTRTCVFVGLADKLLTKFKKDEYPDADYTDWDKKLKINYDG